MKKTLELVVKGKDQASSVLTGVGDSVSRLGTAATNAAMFGIAAAATGVVALGTAAVVAASEVVKMTLAAAEIESVRNTFDNLTESLGGSEYAMDLLQEATRGMVGEAELMQGANKFLAMGLADSAEEAAAMAEMATQLGMAMGEEAGPSMENFALMLANQSIPRLDSFAISSGEARDMINAMMEANEGLTREQAFANVVMELGAEAMAKVGEQGESAAAAMLRWDASMDDLRLHVGQAFIPVLELLQKNFQPIIDEYGPRLVEWAELAATWLGEKLPYAIEVVGGWLSENLPNAAAAVVTYFKTYVFPTLDTLKDKFDVLSEDVMPSAIKSWEKLRMGWEDTTSTYDTRLKPALDGLTGALGTGDIALGKFFGWFIEAKSGQWVDMVTVTIESLTWSVEFLAHWVQAVKTDLDNLRGVVDWVKGAFASLESKLWGVQNVLKWVRDWIDAVATSFRNLDIPDWLRPGSPAPLETALLGIGKAFDKIPELSFGVTAAGAVGGTGVVHITNHFGPGSVRSDADILAIADAVQRSIELRGVRGQIA